MNRLFQIVLLCGLLSGLGACTRTSGADRPGVVRAAPASSLVLQAENDYEMEVAGVASVHGTETRWWLPDGTPLERAPEVVRRHGIVPSSDPSTRPGTIVAIVHRQLPSEFSSRPAAAVLAGHNVSYWNADSQKRISFTPEMTSTDSHGGRLDVLVLDVGERQRSISIDYLKPGGDLELLATLKPGEQHPDYAIGPPQLVNASAIVTSTGKPIEKLAALTRKGHRVKAELLNTATTDGRTETRSWRLPRLHTEDVVQYEIYREPMQRLRFTDIALQPDANTRPTAEDLGKE